MVSGTPASLCVVVLVSGSSADELLVQSSGAHVEPSPSQMSHSSYVDEPRMTPWQSRHDSPLPLQTSQMSYTAGPFGVPAQSRHESPLPQHTSHTSYWQVPL